MCSNYCKQPLSKGKLIAIACLALLSFLLISASDSTVSIPMPSTGTLFPLERNAISVENQLTIIKGKAITAEYALKNVSDTPVTATMAIPIFDDGTFLEYLKSCLGEKEVSDPAKLLQKIPLYFRVLFRFGKESSTGSFSLATGKEGISGLFAYVSCSLDFSPGETKTVDVIYPLFSLMRNNYPWSENEFDTEHGYTLKFGVTPLSLWGKAPDKITVRWYIPRISTEEKIGYYSILGTGSEWTDNILFPGTTPFRLTTEGNGMIAAEWRISPSDAPVEISLTRSVTNVSQKRAIDELLRALYNYKLFTWPSADKSFEPEITKIPVDFDHLFGLDKDKAMGTLRLLYNGIVLAYRWGDVQQRFYSLRVINCARFYRNLAHALYGYQFSSPEWTSFFSRFSWYTAQTTNPVLPAELRANIDKILEIENNVTKNYLRMYP